MLVLLLHTLYTLLPVTAFGLFSSCKMNVSLPDELDESDMKEALDFLFDELKADERKASKEQDAQAGEAKNENGDGDGADVTTTEGVDTIDGADEISSRAFMDALDSLGLSPSEAEVDALLAEVGVEKGQPITRVHFHDMIERYAQHDVGLHEVFPEVQRSEDTSSQVVEKTLKKLESKPSVPMLSGEAMGKHSDMYWAEISNAAWNNFPKGFRIDSHNFVVEADVPEGLDAIGGRKISVGDILLMVDSKRVDKKLPPDAVIEAIKERMKAKGAVNLKFRRGKNNEDYTGEYFVALQEVADVGEMQDNLVLGPIPSTGVADAEGIEKGDLLLAINNEAVSDFHLDTERFKMMCKAALTRDRLLLLHMKHTQIENEPHHNAIHPYLHKLGFFLCGAGCCRSGRELESNDDDSRASGLSVVDAV